MEFGEKPHTTDKYRGITNDLNYVASCTPTSPPVSDLEYFDSLIFVVQSVQLFYQTKSTRILGNATAGHGFARFCIRSQWSIGFLFPGLTVRGTAHLSEFTSASLFISLMKLIVCARKKKI
jgi:hypothetical protein